MSEEANEGNEGNVASAPMKPNEANGVGVRRDGGVLPKKMLELKNLIELTSPGRAVTPADIKAAPGKLRNQAQNAMVHSLSEEQKINYRKCQSDSERHIWVAEYMNDPTKVRYCGVDDSRMMLSARRAQILVEITAATRHLALIDTQFARAGINGDTGLPMGMTPCMFDQMAAQLQRQKVKGTANAE